MRELISTKDLIDALILEEDYYFNIDESIKSIIQARTIIRKYIKNKELKDRALLNHVIIVNNLLGVRRTNYAFYSTFNDEEFKYIKSVLLFMDIYDNKFGTHIDYDTPILELFIDTLNRHKGAYFS